MSLGQEEEDEEEQEVVAPRVVVVPRLAVPLVEEVPQEEVVPLEEVVPRQVGQEVMSVPSLEEASEILKGLQEVLKEKQAACTRCGKTMSKKSIVRHERRCQQARPPPSSAPPSSSASPPSTPAPGSLKRKASEVAVGRRTRARGQ